MYIGDWFDMGLNINSMKLYTTNFLRLKYKLTLLLKNYQDGIVDIQ